MSLSRFKPKSTLSPSASVHLDFIRGIAAFIVMISHWRYLFYADFGGHAAPGAFAKAFYFITGFGHQAVVVFFVLSGYLVGGSVLRMIGNERWSWKRYLADRLTRLWVVIIPALILTAVLDFYGAAHSGSTVYSGGEPYRIMLPDSVYNHLTPAAALGNLFFFQTVSFNIGGHLVGIPFLGTNSPLWSLAFEFWIYIAFPCAMLAFAPVSMKVRIASVLGFLAAMVITHALCLIYFPIWALGAFLAWAEPIKIVRSRAFAALSFLGFLGVLAVSRVAKDQSEQKLSVVIGIFFAAWLWSVIATPAKDQSPLYVRAAKNMSAVSYTLYLVHVPFLVFLAAMLMHNAKWAPDMSHMVKGLGILLLTMVYAVILYFAFEAQTPKVRDLVYDRLGIKQRSIRTDKVA